MSRRVALIHRPTLTPSHQAHPSHTHLRSSSPAPVSLRSRCALAWGYCISLVGSLGPSRLLATRSFHSCIQKHTNSLKSTHTSVYNQPWHDSQPLSFSSQLLSLLVECLRLTVTIPRVIQINLCCSSRKRKFFGVARTALIPAVPAGVGLAMPLVTIRGA